MRSNFYTYATQALRLSSTVAATVCTTISSEEDSSFILRFLFNMFYLSGYRQVFSCDLCCHFPDS